MKTMPDNPLLDPVTRWIILGAVAAIITIVGWAVIDPLRQYHARRRLMDAPTLKSMPTLPTVIPAAFLDASDTTPKGASTYCPACWLEWIREPWRNYFAPEGEEAFCGAHAKSILAHALDTLHEQQAGEKYR